MSTFEEIVGKHEQNNSLSERLKFEELVRLIEEVHAEKPRVLKENKKPKEVRLLTPDFRIDPSWMSIDSGNFPSEREKLAKAINGTGLPREILNLEGFIVGINGVLKEQSIDVSDHAAAISRIQLLRIFYNLATAPDEAISGFLFESLMAMVFGGVRIPTDDKVNGLVDVSFPNSPVSLKLIKTKRTRIKGSLKMMHKSLKAYPDGIKYIIADKVEDAIEFYEFVVDNDETSLNYWDKLPNNGAQFSVALSKLQETRDVRKLTTLSFVGIESRTQEILNALNEKFESLLTTLLDLNDKANELFYTAKSSKETKKRAGETAKKAEDARKSAERIKGK